LDAVCVRVNACVQILHYTAFQFRPERLIIKLRQRRVRVLRIFA